MSPKSTTDEDVPVTVVVTRRIRPGREAAYEEWLRSIHVEAVTFPGLLGTNVIRPPRGSREYTVVLRFDNPANLRRWADSPERSKWLARLAPICEGQAVVQEITGLEAWFTLPGMAPRPAPPRYKMALVSLTAAFPIISFFNWALVPHLGFLPAPLRTLVMGVAMISLMTWVVMPLLTRLLFRWLYPAVLE